MDNTQLKTEVESFLKASDGIQPAAKLIYVYLLLGRLGQDGNNPVKARKGDLLKKCGIKCNSSFYIYIKSLEKMGMLKQIRKKGISPSRFVVYYPSEKKGQSLPMKNLSIERIGSRMKALREKLGLTTQDIAQAADATKELVESWERGEFYASHKYLGRLAKNVCPEYNHIMDDDYDAAAWDENGALISSLEVSSEQKPNEHEEVSSQEPLEEAGELSTPDSEPPIAEATVEKAPDPYQQICDILGADGYRIVMGTAMSPTLNPGDIVFFSFDAVRDGEIGLFQGADEKLRRWQAKPGEICLIADNPQYPVERYPIKGNRDKSISPAGRIIGLLKISAFAHIL